MNLTESYKNRMKSLAGIISEEGEVRQPLPLITVPVITQSSIEDAHRYGFHKEKVKTMNEDGSLNEIKVEDISVPKKYVHDSLNTKIWGEDKEIKKEVRLKLLDIAEEFYNYLEIKAHPKFIKIVGSMANYNWSKNSDIDIHLFFDIKEIGDDIELAKQYIDSKEKLWKQQHKIKVKGFDVELYAQDISDKYYSGGVYDLSKNEWESMPSHEDVKVDNVSLKIKIKSLIDDIDEIETKESDADSDSIYKMSKKLKDKIKKMRQCGLEKEGEFSIENLAFKYLRNNGYLGKLFDMKNKAFDKSLSVDENLGEAKNIDPKYLKKVEFVSKRNPNLKIIVTKTPDGRITEIQNEIGLRFPFNVGQILNRNHEVWACNNNFLVDNKDTCPEEKIFGIRKSDIPKEHEFRLMFPGKFNNESKMTIKGLLKK